LEQRNGASISGKLVSHYFQYSLVYMDGLTGTNASIGTDDAIMQKKNELILKAFMHIMFQVTRISYWWHGNQ